MYLYVYRPVQTIRPCKCFIWGNSILVSVLSGQVTHHHTPLIAATIASKANRAANRLPSATHWILSLPKIPKSEDLFVTEEEIKIHLGFANAAGWTVGLLRRGSPSSFGWFGRRKTQCDGKITMTTIYIYKSTQNLYASPDGLNIVQNHCTKYHTDRWGYALGRTRYTKIIALWAIMAYWLAPFKPDCMIVDQDEKRVKVFFVSYSSQT